VALGLSLLAGGCATEAGNRGGVTRYDRDTLEAELDAPEQLEVVLGMFPLQKDGIVDGDTLKVGGLDESLRLLAIDTEETFKSDKARRAFEEGWERYLASEQAKTSRPVKIPTPLGEDAKAFAKQFFKGARRVRLERDHPKEIRGRFNRLLTYVFVEREGEWLNYNVEAVRAGMSPYFTKYAYSRRFHDEFERAQEEARAAHRGIWDPSKMHYRDYPLRLEWWNARAETIAEFEREAEGRDDMIVLTHWDALKRLESQLDREVEILATVGDIRPREGKRPARVMLSRRMFGDLPLVFWDEDVLEQTKIGEYKGEFVRVSGLITQYVNKKSGWKQLQIEVKMPGQVKLPNYVPPGKDEAAPRGGVSEQSEPESAPSGSEAQPGAPDPSTEPAPTARWTPTSVGAHP
jgi:endonuclease YncB( thermonuclease family)